MRAIISLIFIFALTRPLEAQQSSTTSPALFPITVGSKYGYIDTSGNIVIQPRFDDAWRFSEGLAPVRIEEKWGYIDQTGKIVIAPQFFEVMPFAEGLAQVGAFFKAGPIDDRVGNYGYIDKTGRFVIAPQFSVAFDFTDGLAGVLTEDFKHGYIDKTGKEVFWNKRLADNFYDGLARFQTNGNMPGSKTGYIDKDGKTAISPTLDAGENFSDGLACVWLHKKAGFIDTKGNIAIDFRFDRCSSFSEGLAAVMISDKWGYIDKSGNMVVAPIFAEVQPFSNGVAVVRVDGSEFPPKAERRIEGTNIAIEAGRFGVIDRSGRLLLQPQFFQLGDFSDGLAWVNLGQKYIVHGDVEKWGYINKSGKLVWKSFADNYHGLNNSLR
jgi:hypothetical protein